MTAQEIETIKHDIEIVKAKVADNDEARRAFSNIYETLNLLLIDAGS